MPTGAGWHRAMEAVPVMGRDGQGRMGTDQAGRGGLPPYPNPILGLPALFETAWTWTCFLTGAVPSSPLDRLKR